MSRFPGVMTAGLLAPGTDLEGELGDRHGLVSLQCQALGSLCFQRQGDRKSGSQA